MRQNCQGSAAHLLNYWPVHLYCFDGTNVVRIFWGYGGPQFKAQEESDCAMLTEALATLCRNLADSIAVELFFDGPQRSCSRTLRVPRNLRVRFAGGESSDQLILDRVRTHKWKAQGGVTVVTGDGDLGGLARAEGGKWLPLRPGQDLRSILHNIERRFTRS